MGALSGKRVAIMVEEQYQDLEVWYPYYRLREEGAQAVFVGTGSAEEYKGKYGYPVKPDTTVATVSGGDFDAVVVPGGFAPDFFRRCPQAIEFIRQANDAGKVIAAICHGAWALISAGVVKGKRMTCFSAIKDDVVNAGGLYTDEAVVVDGTLVTSRKPDDLPQFTRRLVDALSQIAEAAHTR